MSTRSTRSRSNGSAGANSKVPNGSFSARRTVPCIGRKSRCRTRSGHGSSSTLACCWPVPDRRAGALCQATSTEAPRRQR